MQLEFPFQQWIYRENLGLGFVSGEGVHWRQEKAEEKKAQKVFSKLNLGRSQELPH